MSVFRIPDDTVVDTAKATAHYEEATDWNGSNHISRATGSQWEHETLYRSAKGRWYVVHTSQCEGNLPHAEYVSPAQAAAWLVLNEHELPADLAEAGGQVTE